jgi:hypothetical protein
MCSGGDGRTELTGDGCWGNGDGGPFPRAVRMGACRIGEVGVRWFEWVGRSNRMERVHGRACEFPRSPTAIHTHGLQGLHFKYTGLPRSCRIVAGIVRARSLRQPRGCRMHRHTPRFRLLEAMGFMFEAPQPLAHAPLWRSQGKAAENNLARTGVWKSKESSNSNS